VDFVFLPPPDEHAATRRAMTTKYAKSRLPVTRYPT
jgi:hypothetical protein